MTQKQKSLIDGLIDSIPEKQKKIFEEIAYYFIELGYIPHKSKVKDFILIFKHSGNSKVISKMGIRKQKAFVSIRFFACKNIPEKYMDALRNDLDSRDGQYGGLLRSNTEKNKCGYCPVCTGGGIGYYYKYPDGKEILRCGAYPIEIPVINEADIKEMKEIILEQHDYFHSIA